LYILHDNKGGKMKNKMTGTVAFIGLAFLLGTAVIGCERGDTGAPGAPGAQGAAAPAPAPAAPQVAEKTSPVIDYD
jgi:hypothetical protein